MASRVTKLVEELEERFPRVCDGHTKWSDKLQLVYVGVPLEDLLNALEEIKKSVDFYGVSSFEVSPSIRINNVGTKVNIVDIKWTN